MYRQYRLIESVSPEEMDCLELDGMDNAMGVGSTLHHGFSP
jgi:hypothetical protein